MLGWSVRPGPGWGAVDVATREERRVSVGQSEAEMRPSDQSEVKTLTPASPLTSPRSLNSFTILPHAGTWRLWRNADLTNEKLAGSTPQ